MIDPRIQKLAQIILGYSTDVKRGDLVFIRGLSPAAEPLMQMLYQEALAKGARVFTYMHMNMQDALALEATRDIELLSEPNPMLLQMYAQADVVIGIHASNNLRELSSYPADVQSALAQAHYEPIRIQKQRQASGSIRRCTTLFPTQAYAQAVGMSLPQYTDFVFRAGKLYLDDPITEWLMLRARQERLVGFLAGKKYLNIRGKHIDLSMSIAGRTFINSAGTANFPDGEIFTGPVEDSVNGWVQFSYPATYNSVKVDGIELRFEGGKVVGATARENEAFLYQMMDIDDGARVLGEFAIGTNTDIQQFTGATLFDEKIAGTIHLALGQGFPETGSRNQSGIHWDMVYDMRGGGEITADGEVFYRDGEFTVD